MTPTPNLRVVTYKTQATAAEVRNLADEWELPMEQAKAELQDVQGPFLEQWWEYGFKDDDGNELGEWRRIEHVIEWRNK